MQTRGADRGAEDWASRCLRERLPKLWRDVPEKQVCS